MSSPEVVRFEDLSRRDTLTRDWLDLAARLDETSYFQTPDWVLGWWETIARRPRTRAAAWRAPSGRLEALVVLSRDRQRLHRTLVVSFPVYVNAGSGPGAADHCGWLVPGEQRDEVSAWLSQVTGGAGLLLRSADPLWGRPPLPAGARVVGTTICPRMRLPSPDQPVGRSPDFRRQLGRFTRRLEREGVQFAWVPAGSVDEELLKALFELHERARANRGVGTAFGPDQLALHRRLVARSDPCRGPAAVVARHDGAVAGVLYGFCWKDTFAAYQWGWDPRWAHYSMGSVLAYQGIRYARANGARTFDFLRGTEPYKYRFGAIDRCDRTWLVPRGPAGRLMAARYRVSEWRHRRGRPRATARS
jgi:CelD/BcsL family acetyltransferase involved in cellulose biosynthesis